MIRFKHKTTAASSPYEFTANMAPIVIVIGQSNADGRGNLTDLPDTDVTFSGEVKIWDKSVTRDPANEAVNRVDDGYWKDYAIGDMIVSPQGAAATAIGPETQLARRWRDEVYPTVQVPLYILKLAVGGTSLADAGVDRSWSDTTDSLRELLIDYIVKPAIKELQQQGLKPILLGTVLGQGESDAQNTSQAAAYEANLTQFITDVRDKIGFPGSRFLVMGLSDYPGGADWQAVKDAQSSVSGSLSNVVLIPTDGSDDVVIGRYLSGVAAGNIHYSSEGVLALGNKFFENLDFTGAEYIEQYDAAVFAPSFLDFNFSKVKTGMIGECATYGGVRAVQYPTTGASVNAITWVRGGENIVRPALNSTPIPGFTFQGLSGHTDLECIFRMAHDGNVDCKPGPFMRMVSAPCAMPDSGYLFQVRLGGGTLTIFRKDGSFVPLAEVTPTQSPAVGDFYWYRCTISGTLLTMDNSPDGKTWTNQISVTDATYASGDFRFDLFNGFTNKTVGNLRTANCAFDVLTIRKL